MGYYEEETRALSAVLLSLYSQQGERAYHKLETALRQLTFPPSVRRLCEEALQAPGDCRDTKSVRCLLQALEDISGYKHVERYIVQRNQNMLFS
ncbi:hypothetical protein [Citrobacter rodentium]|jgi:hypothetical protein|nr:hypothetical protein [Citrobacter rodentium]KIQ51374.1 hypothetical protein TA05_10610 [Citrobacter rodentium]QBY29356.1 hypothetical protein E2R62_11130 [Citrobacter rodentium]UHO33242.1 hypothetical protein K7R23_11855 [Citrobacter rodentium NBRC 105723 = DSM 16636]HAT8015171.1 hypothetical protein [Citrobacter rodentium NBRC 105723 = DSM 16636]HAT8017510.1 hypothetical protein [Citrobacter rodentium]